LSGWWGSDVGSRFQMENRFVPIPGAAGWQLSNPSAIDATAVLASLSVFGMTSMEELRGKSLKLTWYLEELLKQAGGMGTLYTIITPESPDERGAQLSVLLKPGLLDTVMEVLEEEGVVLDERKPDVIRVAPTPLYNTFVDVWRFNDIFQKALKIADDKSKPQEGNSLMVEGGQEKPGWGQIK